MVKSMIKLTNLASNSWGVLRIWLACLRRRVPKHKATLAVKPARLVHSTHSKTPLSVQEYVGEYALQSCIWPMGCFSYCPALQSWSVLRICLALLIEHLKKRRSRHSLKIRGKELLSHQVVLKASSSLPLNPVHWAKINAFSSWTSIVHWISLMIASILKPCSEHDCDAD
jgi:hypothetical protein